MFGSDYFSGRQEDAEESVQKKSSIRKKDSSNCASHLRMNKVVEINCPQLSEESSQGQDSLCEPVQQQARQQAEQPCNPSTIYLRSKKKVYYLYEQQYKEI